MTRKIEKSDHCLNCGTEINDSNYCPNCGQFNNAHKPNLFEFIRDAFENLFAFDSRFYRSISVLLWRPGRLTQNFNKGQKARYMMPVRLFIVVSIFLIAAASCVNRSEKEHWYDVDVSDTGQGQNSFFDLDRQDSLIADTTRFDPEAWRELKDRKLIRWDSNANAYRFQEADTDENINLSLSDPTLENYFNFAKNNRTMPVDEALAQQGMEQTFWNRLTYHYVLKIGHMSPSQFNSFISRNMIIILLLFIPFIAIALKLVYIYKKILYVDHFVFAIHIQSAGFAYATLAIILSLFLSVDLLIPLALLGFVVYVFIALKRYYQQGFFLTLLNFIVVNILLLFISFIFILLVAAVTVLLI